MNETRKALIEFAEHTARIQDEIRNLQGEKFSLSEDFKKYLIDKGEYNYLKVDLSTIQRHTNIKLR